MTARLDPWMLAHPYLLGNVHGHVAYSPKAFIKTERILPDQPEPTEGATVQTEGGAFLLGKPLGRT